jgi:uncharacterized protein
MKNERFEMRVSAELLEQIDDWRRRQTDIPSRAEAIRQLVELALGTVAKRKREPKS